MKTTGERYGRRWLQLLSLLGALYCLANAAGAELLCGTRGCAIYAGYGLFGLSFYWYGVAGFLGLLTLTFSLRTAFGRWLLALTLIVALTLDSLFLLYQALLWPCSSCQLAALLIGLAALVAWRHLNLPWRKLLVGVGIVWGLLFSYVGINIVKELAFHPWALYGSSAAPVKIYFSPTCSACEKVVRQLLADPQGSEQAAFYPVAKNDQDEARLARLLSKSDHPLEDVEILGLFNEAPTVTGRLDLGDRMRLLSNKMFLARSDATRVPLIISPHILQLDDRRQDTLSLPLVPLWEPPGGTKDNAGCSMVSSGAECTEDPATTTQPN